MKGETKPLLSEDINFCPECNGRDIIDDKERGERICRGCGLVIEERKKVDLKIGARSEVYTDSYHSPGLLGIHGSKISIRKNDQRGFTPKQLSNANSLRKTEKYFSIKNKNLVVGLIILENITKSIKTPENIKVDVIRYFKQALDKKLTAGRSYEEIIAGSIFIAHKKNKNPKSIKELAEQTSVPAKKIYKCCRLLIKELELKINIIFKPEDFISQICGEVGADITIERKTLEIIREFKKRKNILGKNPLGITTAAIYLVSEKYLQMYPEKYKKITQNELSLAGSITDVILRRRYKEMMETLPIKKQKSN
jgi:transcription initiation factor TFIIB